MRVVIQRVRQAAVTINQVINGQIQHGLLVLVGIETADTMEDIEWISNKIVNLRIFDDAAGVMNCSVKEVDGEILLISQFTLHASTKKGNRPSYSKAAQPVMAIPIYEELIKVLGQELGKPIPTGIFGADMQVSLVNNGPVTITIDSKDRE